ncbi:MAG TPA: quinoprotein dehydrogenase-associated putative ABC transporter substrate-binding protein [Gammaproteobacteria bacterium]|nr:quinoprotein dehydrogenase-associated putative ABC transporter substrate-binding protein [Gammaproteobacteria bacterium]
MMGRSVSSGSTRIARQLQIIGSAILALLFLVAMLSTAAHASAPPAPWTKRPLRVCADPNDLPFSNRAQQGFENKLAQLVASRMNTYVEYEWWPQRQKFLDNTLYAHHCDVVMGWAAHSDAVLTTKPYYRSAYAIVYRKSASYDIRSLRDPLLRKLQIGVHAVGDDWFDLPGGAVLANRGIVKNVHVYTLFSNYGRPNPSAELIEAVASGDVDVAIAWGPLAGYFAKYQPVDLVVVPLVNAHAKLPFEFSISAAVRKGDTELRDKLNRILENNRDQINALLASYNVPLLPLTDAEQHSKLAAAD